LISDISEEVHRFAITYHRKKRVSSSMENTLTKVSGIGDKTAAKLFRKYKSLSAIRGHTAEEISKDIKIPLAVAERLLVFLNERG
jgi:excinuclease ABC subunit C